MGHRLSVAKSSPDVVADESFNAYSRDPRQQVGRESESVGCRRVYRNWRRGLPLHWKRIQTSGTRSSMPVGKIGGEVVIRQRNRRCPPEREIDPPFSSMKDVPTAIAVTVSEILCVPPREDLRDALITRDGIRLDQLKPGARINHSSLRRQARCSTIAPILSLLRCCRNLDTPAEIREGQLTLLCWLRQACVDWNGCGDHGVSSGCSRILPAICSRALGIEGAATTRSCASC